MLRALSMTPVAKGQRERSLSELGTWVPEASALRKLLAPRPACCLVTGSQAEVGTGTPKGRLRVAGHRPGNRTARDQDKEL